MPFVRQRRVVIFKIGDNLVVHCAIEGSSTPQGLQYISSHRYLREGLQTIQYIVVESGSQQSPFFA